MNRVAVVIGLMFFTLPAMAQNQVLPYAEIPDTPADYTAANVAARMIDGLGFRFYWATEGLRSEDLGYKPSEEARTTAETIDHIYSLSVMIVNAFSQTPNTRDGDTKEKLSFEQIRDETLQNLKQSSDILKQSTAENLAEFKIVLAGANRTTELPFWNLINGPIADALWHTGQIVSFRRASGNPLNANVNVLTGKVRE